MALTDEQRIATGVLLEAMLELHGRMSVRDATIAMIDCACVGALGSSGTVRLTRAEMHEIIDEKYNEREREVAARAH